MTKKQSFFWREGYDRGRAIAQEVDIPGPGQESVGSMGVSTIDSASDAYDYMVGASHEVEEYDRQFSPFELRARTLNEYGDWMASRDLDPEAGWDAFNEGIAEGIRAMVAVRLGGYTDADF